MKLPRRFFLFGLVLLFFTVFSLPAPAEDDIGKMVSDFVNMNEIVNHLQLAKFKDKPFTRKIKIAIFDNGFRDYKNLVGSVLPADTVYHQGKPSEADNIQTESLHGLFMAVIVSKLLHFDKDSDYELHLFKTYGYTKFADAVDTVIHDRFDIVLYSQVWQFGGNGDGKGFIDVLVDKATQAGIIWINAAGNFGQTTRLAPVRGQLEGPDKWAVFKSAKGKESGGVRIECRPPKGKTCDLSLVVAWNDFKDDPEGGTDKDLGAYLYNSKGKLVASADKKQRLTSDPSDPEVSIIPRELIDTKIGPGIYRIRVKINSDNFSPDHDVMRITAAGEGIAMENPSVGETLLPPADDANVITIGASDDPRTSTSTKMKKPEVDLFSAIKLKDGSVPFESSTAAAMAAAVAVLDIGTGLESTRTAVLNELKKLSHPIETPKLTVARRVTTVRKAPTRTRSAQANPPYGSPSPDGLPNNVPFYPPTAGSEWVQDTDQGTRPAPPPIGPAMPARAIPEAVAPPAHCLAPARLPVVYPAVRELIDDAGGRPVLLNGQPAILFAYDFAVYNGIPLSAYQRLVVTPQGVMVLDERQPAFQMPPNYYYVVSSSAAVCN